MVIKFSTCTFSEYKIAPGHGIKYAEVNGKVHTFISKKTWRLFRQSKKPLAIRWTLKWRTAHKKGKAEESKKHQKKEKVVKQVKAIVGLSLDEIQKIKDQFKDERMGEAMRHKYAQEIKDKKKKYLDKQKKARGGDTKQDKFVPKNVKATVPKGAQSRGTGKK
jgi:large subunit ribosomal protein L24e